MGLPARRLTRANGPTGGRLRSAVEETDTAKRGAVRESLPRAILGTDADAFLAAWHIFQGFIGSIA